MVEHSLKILATEEKATTNAYKQHSLRTTLRFTQKKMPEN